MGRYLQIYRHFIASSLVRELEFRANFVAKIAQALVWLGFSALVLIVIYSNTDSVAGWNQGAAFILTSTSFLMYHLVMAFCFSLVEIPEMVRKGTLDFVVTKPVDSQFWVSLRRFNFDQIGACLGGVAMLALGVVQSGAQPGPLNWLAYLIMLVCATITYYCIQFFLMTLGIWFVRVDNLWVLGETIMAVARYPNDIYSVGLQRFFTFVLPVAFLATIPTRQLVQTPHWDWVLGGLAWAFGSFIASRLFWQRSMRSYSSASS
ncbi:MAG: ABC-2 family transporter protein [Fimbriimonadaceae bacterium]|nr:ABC-2 family transporter protein [Fimbriimonadaceae bacterium]